MYTARRVEKPKKNVFFFYRLYLVVYDRHYCIFWDIWQRNHRGTSWRVLCSTLMAKFTEYFNVMGPSLSVMNHFFVYFLLSLLNITRQRHTLVLLFSNRVKTDRLPPFSILIPRNWSCSVTKPKTSWAPWNYPSPARVKILRNIYRNPIYTENNLN